MNSFYAMGTEWWIACDRLALLPKARSLVLDLEQVLSRFQSDSVLSQLNQVREVESPLLAEVISLALDAKQRTKGVFDPCLGAQIRALGYDRDFGSGLPVAQAGLAPDTSIQVIVDGPMVRLVGTGLVDLGGIGKGWAVDRVHDFLREAGARKVLVDGGGDIRVSGKRWELATPKGHRVRMTEGALATSSSLKRSWSDTAGNLLHHLLDPVTGRPAQSPIVTVTVQAASALWAEVYAKTILIRPSFLSRLPELGMAAAVQGRDLRWWTTENWGSL